MGTIARLFALLILTLFAACQTPPRNTQPKDHVVLISIDGLRPEFYQSDAYDTPNLKRLAAEGAYAKACRGVDPTMTYPTHASIVTGVEPMAHGILTNTRFNPNGKDEWYSNADDLKRQTVWGQAKAKGLKVALIYWPTTVGAKVDWLIPELHDFPALAQATTPGLLESVQKEYGPFKPEYAKDNAKVDEFLVKAAAYILKHHQPNLTLVHLIQVDEAQHKHGRDHEDVRKAIANVDQALGFLLSEMDQAGLRDTFTFIVTGDHGFADVHTSLSPNTLLLKAGLITVKEKKLTDWKVMVHASGASAVVYAHDPKDKKSIQAAMGLLNEYERENLWHVHEISPRAEASGTIVATISAEKGYSLSGSWAGGFKKKSRDKGNHGYPSDWPEMHTGLILFGTGIDSGTVWERASLLDIAPTIASWLDLDMGKLPGKRLD